MIEDIVGLPLDLPPAAERALHAAGAAWHDEAAAEAHVQAALAAAPDALAARIAAYKFYFYRHRLDAALGHAEAVRELAARRLQLPPDWRIVAPGDAAFDRIEPWPRLYVQALIASGYVLARLGRLDEGRAALVKAAELDGPGKFGAARLVAAIDRGGNDDEDEDNA